MCHELLVELQIRSEKLREKVELWKDKALIGKFIGIWLKERDLIRWIKQTWNPKGHYDMHLVSKGFFTIIFFNQEDWGSNIGRGPYFFFLVGLYL